MESNELYRLIKQTRDRVIPPPERVVDEAFRELGLASASPKDVLRNFNEYLKSVFNKTLEVLERYEDDAYRKEILSEICRVRSHPLLSKAFPGRVLKRSDFIETTSKALELLYPDLWHVFLSRSQSRKARGGLDFQIQVAKLLSLAGVPFEQQIRRYKVDFLIPSLKAFNADRTRTSVLSAKRTLRERWREVVEELYNTRCPNVYLATTNSEAFISEEKVSELKRYNIHLVVWDEVKEAKFREEPMVIGYSRFANSDLMVFKEYWKSLS